MQADPFAYVPQFTAWAPIAVTGAWVSNTTYTFVWSRQHDTLRMAGSIALSGTPTAASLTINTPTINGAQVVIDSTKLSGGASFSLNSILGNAWVFSTGNGRLPCDVTYSSTTLVSLLSLAPAAASTHYFSQVNSTFPVTWQSGDSIEIYFEAPIVGWGTST